MTQSDDSDYRASDARCEMIITAREEADLVLSGDRQRVSPSEAREACRDPDRAELVVEAVHRGDLEPEGPFDLDVEVRDILDADCRLHGRPFPCCLDGEDDG